MQDLAEQAYDALEDDDGEEAETLLKEAVALEPDSPDLLNNLCKAYEIQDRTDEARAMTEEIHRRFPDYLFARVTLAAVHAKEGRVEEAKALLDPLLTQTEFHISEFAALCMAEVELALAQNQREAGQHWVDMLARVDPDHPTLPNLRMRLLPPSTFEKLFRNASQHVWKRS
ncbi:MAG: tetratricopeptide repeat protein [Anaerolineae bacterium]|nr:tetratricopeptide repeat protein [Anaerolineae bacterium]